MGQIMCDASEQPRLLLVASGIVTVALSRDVEVRFPREANWPHRRLSETVP